MKLSIIPRRCSTLFPFSICRRVEIKMMNNCPLCLPAYVRYFRVISSQQGDENLTYLKFVALRSRCGLKCTRSLKFVPSNSFIRALFLQEPSLPLKSLVWSIRRCFMNDNRQRLLNVLVNYGLMTFNPDSR